MTSVLRFLSCLLLVAGLGSEAAWAEPPSPGAEGGAAAAKDELDLIELVEALREEMEPYQERPDWAGHDGKFHEAWFLNMKRRAARMRARPKELAKENPEVLAKDAREKGEAARGAILFYQERLTCRKCHEFGKETEPLGPDLTKPEKEPTDVFLVESILQPSKEIRKGYEPIIVITDAGKAITGLKVKEDDKELVLRDPNKDGELVTIAKDEIDEQEQSTQSVMPTELINQLGNRQQFLDLLRYVMEVSKGGLARARQLEPEPSLYARPPLPEYEKNIDQSV